MGYSTVNVDEIEGAGPGGAVRFVRRPLGAEVPVRAGSVVRLDPDSVRCPVSGPEGMTFVAVGAPPGAYEPRGPF